MLSMKIIRKIYKSNIDDESLKYCDENTCLMDIETTGFDRNKCHIYMIGLARVVNDCHALNFSGDALDGDVTELAGGGHTFEVTLLFAENKFEEKTVLDAYLEYSEDITRFITFNGLSFDFPFIKSRLQHYGETYDFEQYDHIDIYKECKCLKDMLHLDNLKQKTIESFLGISREDKYSGGELTEQYHTYSKTKDATLYYNLITHNLEDVKGMIDLLVILRYTRINNIIDTDSDVEVTFNPSEVTIKVSMHLRCRLPKSFVIKSEYYYIKFEDDMVKILLKPDNTSMKYFLEDYSKYMYLPDEGIVIPKQLLNKNNKKNAIKATKENCYVSKSGLFMPVYDTAMFDGNKLFKSEYSDKQYFVDVSGVVDDKIYIKNYILHIIKKETA